MDGVAEPHGSPYGMLYLETFRAIDVFTLEKKLRKYPLCTRTVFGMNKKNVAQQNNKRFINEINHHCLAFQWRPLTLVIFKCSTLFQYYGYYNYAVLIKLFV